jgi:hypothetical protein
MAPIITATGLVMARMALFLQLVHGGGTGQRNFRHSASVRKSEI